LLQVALFLGIDLAYEATRHVSAGAAATAFAHARDVVHVEQAIGIFDEESIQRWALSRPWAIDVANVTYFAVHFVISIVFITWVYFRRHDHYRFVRNIVFITDLLALVGYLIFPSAPPRMLHGLGIIDTLATAAVSQHSPAIADLANPFAAVPSIHTAYALIVSAVLLALSRRRIVRLAAALYPALIVFTIVVTGNHFWLDAVSGALVVALAMFAAWRIEARWPTLPESARARLRLTTKSQTQPSSLSSSGL
jgi:PAP2 superfamily